MPAPLVCGSPLKGLPCQGICPPGHTALVTLATHSLVEGAGLQKAVHRRTHVTPGGCVLASLALKDQVGK